MSVLQSSANWVIEQAKLRLGDEYVYGGVYSAADVSHGADCSGVVGWALQALVDGPAAVSWQRVVNTESWAPGAPAGTVGPFGTIAVDSLADIPPNAAATVNIMHGGGGAYSHTNIVIPLPHTPAFEGVLVESNGSYGSCTNNTGAYPSTASLWTDHHYLPGGWVFDVAPVLPTDAPPASGNTVTVQLGDTLDGIAGRLGVTVEALLQANPQIRNPNLIVPGERISVP